MEKVGRKKEPFSTEPVRLGEVCDILGVSRGALHKWEALGLIVATRDRRYRSRIYDRKQIPRVRRIAKCRSWGIPLDQIATVFAAGNGETDFKNIGEFIIAFAESSGRKLGSRRRQALAG